MFKDFELKEVEVESLAKTATVEDVPPSEPPKRRRGRPKGSTNKSKLLPVSEIKDGITQFVGLLGLGVSVVDTYDGGVIIKQAEPVADAVANMAAKDSKMHAQLTKLLRAGSYAALATAGIPIVLAIGANQGMCPETLLMDTGVEPTLNTAARVPSEDDSQTLGDNGGNPLNESALHNIMNFGPE